MQALTNDYKRNYLGIVIFGVGDEPHKRRISDHNEDDTEGSKSAQSDSDNTPEHRAIDVMLGPAFSREQARVSLREVLDDPKNRERLWYVNFENTQWSMPLWTPHDNSDDPHPDHIHYSGLASKDDDRAPWLGVRAMRTATLYRHSGTGACLLRDGGYNYGIATMPELQAIQRLIKTAGGDTTVRDVTAEDWAVLLKTGATVTVDLTELAAAIVGHFTRK